MGIETKTIGELIDQLTIENIKLYMAQEPNSGATVEKLKELNKRRNALIRAIDERLGDAQFSKMVKTY